MPNSYCIDGGSEWKKSGAGLNAEDSGVNQKSAGEATSFVPKQPSAISEQPKRGGPPSFFNSKLGGTAS